MEKEKTNQPALRLSTAMVAGFRRSLSLPGINPGSPGPKRCPPPEKSFHARSTSLPCRSHPLISQLEDEVRALRAWQARPEPETTSLNWASSGLRHLESLHAALDDLLQLPQAHDTLRRRSPWADLALEDFLRFADAYHTFRAAIIALKHHAADIEAAIRGRDEARLAACLRAQKKTEKEIVKLASSLRDVARLAAGRLGSTADAEEAELAGVVREVAAVTVSATASVFLAAAAASSTGSTALTSSEMPAWVVRPLRLAACKRKTSAAAAAAELEILESLEEWFGALEEKSERVFRCFVNTRVTLLNILTPFSC